MSTCDQFTLICKPEQSGKTFLMINMINEALADESERSARVINIIFCDNNLLLTKQTSTRVENEVNAPDIERSYTEFSSRKGDDSDRDANAVYGKIVDGVRNVICCTNGTRVSDISALIRRINNHPALHKMFGRIVFKLWLDEADKFDRHITKTLMPLAQEFGNVQCFCMTATPVAFFEKYGSMNVLPIENTTNPDYHGWCDNRIELRENEHGTVEGFARQIVDEVSQSEAGLVPGSKWYVPADCKKSSHEAMRDLLCQYRFAVFVVNGDGIGLTLPDGASANEHKTMELHAQVQGMIERHGADQYPIAITGNICVSRGISIMNPDFIFDYGVLCNCSNKAEASQKAGRLKGNIKRWKGYKPAVVFTTAEFDRVANEFEMLSRELGSMAFAKDCSAPSIITQKEFRSIGHKAPAADFEHRVFDSDRDAIEWARSNLGATLYVNNRGAPAALLQAGNNPTLESVVARKWGLNAQQKWRKIPLNDGRTCLYWRPSCVSA